MGQYVDPSLLIAPLARDVTARALETVAARATTQDIAPMVVADYDHVAASALPVLGEQLGVLKDIGWQLADTDAKQRAFLKEAVRLVRLRGTPYAIRRIFALMGLGTVTIEEGRGGKTYDGAQTHDGFALYGDASAGWAEYRVKVSVLLNATQAALATALCKQWQPARCRLFSVDFSGALLHNTMATYNGAYSYGAYDSATSGYLLHGGQATYNGNFIYGAI